MARWTKNGIIRFTGGLHQRQIRILKFLYKQPKRRATLSDLTALENIERGSVYSSVRGLIAKGYVRKIGPGFWELASAGRRYVEGMA